MWLFPKLWFGATCRLCFNNLVRLLLVVVCGLGGVQGFAKLPDGDGSTSATGNAGTLRRAVSDWIAGGASRSTVVATYGPIQDWDVSDVNHLGGVFYGVGDVTFFQSFNADISKWNVGAVHNMKNSKCSLYSTKKKQCFASTNRCSFFFFFFFFFLLWRSIYACKRLQW